MQKKIKKTKRRKKKSFTILLMILCILGGVFFYQMLKKNNKTKSLFQDIHTTCFINDYSIYGNHFNLSGNCDHQKSNLTLVLKNEKEEITFPLEQSLNQFQTSKKINTGIDLEQISKGNYYLFLKTEEEYYTLKDQSNNQPIDYYKLKQEGHITLKKGTIKIQNKEKNYIAFHVDNDTNKNIYDVVIDPGHGGYDTGAASLKGDYNESDITLMVAKKTKQELEKLGLKVKLTREDEHGLEEYGKNGRAVIPNQVKAKLTISLHLNSSEIKGKFRGVEIYTAPNIDLTFASSLAQNIVNLTGTNYSNNTSDRVQQGIYIRTFDRQGIKEANENAQKYNYSPYAITTNTPALYMIRETGGALTGAYVDGRNPKYDKNLFYDFKQVTESYLIELGYIIDSKDLNNILNHTDLYAKAIKKSIQERYGL